LPWQLILIRTKVAHREQRTAILMKTIGTLLFTLILSGFSAPRCGATVYYSNGSVANVQAIHNNQAVDGDIIVLPAGVFRWTAGLNITKGVTIKGATTISGAGTANPIINDGTIVRDDTPRSGAAPYILAARMARGNQSFRLTGITFAAGTTTAGPTLSNGPIRLHSDAENKLMRVDHCHFDRLYQGRCIWPNGRCHGVADHNVMQARTGAGLGVTQAFFIQHTDNEAWADYPWYGTDKFFFIEDNTISGFINLTDSYLGGRFVVRHNYLINAIVTDHGTEGGTVRGVRCKEVYNNTFYWNTAGHPGGQRSGTCLWHDNTVIGPSAPTPSGVLCNFTNYREGYFKAHPNWGIADGTSVWDANDTEGNGTFVEGHAPHLFNSGSATSATAEGKLTDNTKRWTTNQWAGYSIKHTNPVSASYGLGSYIISNTATTITFANCGGNQVHLIFNAGDTYKIHRVLVMMDQNGRGKTRAITGNPPHLVSTGQPGYANSALEPCYSWNNVYAPTGQVLGLRADAQQPTTKEGIDYFNLGKGFPANTTPSAVSYRYNAALNGVQYTRTFVYPHPLVTAQP
jgi:hypothetical protein